MPAPEPDERIRPATRAAEDEEILALLEPEVAAWFTGRFAGFTPPQRYAVKEVHDRANVLISSPTGTGKTLSAFLAALNELVALGKEGALEDRVYVLYISPLKALNNDIERNLQGPLAGIRAAFEEAGGEMPELRVGVRTGDTTQHERQKMTKRPPHILITTPESLAILLNAPVFRGHLKKVAWVIVDEVHALAENKRGTHLSLSLERLVAGMDEEPTRIGLSATVSPLDEVAAFLVGRAEDGGHRPCLLVDVTSIKDLELSVLAPTSDLLAARPGDVQRELYAALDALIEAHTTTLLFTNTRAGTERVAHHLQERFGEKYEDLVGAHHGSLSKDVRLSVEERLKAGELKAVVTSTSLELGIDIGYVDLVILLSSPKGVARALQRIGRSGHQLGATSKGILIALDRDDLLECTLLASEARAGRLDPVRIPQRSLDVLCQHLVGMSLEKRWAVDEALAAVRRAEPYHDLPREDLEACLRYLGGREDLEDKSVYAKLWYDPEAGLFGRRGKRTQTIYYTNIGTIPDTTQIRVFHGDAFVGTVEEEFLESLEGGDVFMLGGRTWQYRGASPVKARVVPAKSATPTVPLWFSETMPLSFEAAQRLDGLRTELAAIVRKDGRAAAAGFLENRHALPGGAAAGLAAYIEEQERYVGVSPPGDVLVEEHEDAEGNANLVFHTALGRRANDALARAFAHHASRKKGVRVPHVVGDLGFMLTLPPLRKLTVEDVRALFLIDLERTLFEALEGSEIMRRRFRHVAARSLMILRRYGGRQISVGRQNAAARRLLKHLERTRPDAPVLRETYNEVLHDAFDFANARAYLFRFLSREADVRFVRGLPGPSPFAFNLAAATGANAVLAEGRRDVLAAFQETVERVLGG